MNAQCALITGANGEIGHSLLKALAATGNSIISIDLNEHTPEHTALCEESITGDILDEDVIRAAEKYDIDVIFHLAALLSKSAELNPERAHRVNVEGTLQFLQLAQRVGKRRGKSVKVLFPSTIAVYGIPTLEEKRLTDKLREDEYQTPITMYSANKLYNEHLGRYYSDHYRQMSEIRESGYVDFRGVRFPGLISAFTVPSGGTSDFAPEMIHKAAQGLPYSCFVRPDAQIPFMAMPDGVKALIDLADAPLEKLTRRIYNIGAFAPTASEIAELTQQAFPGAEITFAPDIKRQAIIDSWPADVDDSAANRDWNWQPDYDLNRTFFEYLAPNIAERYQNKYANGR